MPRYEQLLHDNAGRVDTVDAAVLLAHAAGKSRTWLYAHGADEADPAVVERYAGLVARRIAGEPVAYLTGRRGFRHLDLRVTPDTLVPRPETELLVELALERLPAAQACLVADLGTGSGAIALAVASERPRARVVATDASAAALAVARGNAAELGLANVEFRAGDWFAPLDGECFDLVASNPPYIATDDPHLGEVDLRFEPPAALSSGPDGLDAIRTIVRDAPAHLSPGGWLLLEHGWKQGADVQALLSAAGFDAIRTVRDLEQRDRVTLGRYNH